MRDPSTSSPQNEQEELLPAWITPALVDETQEVWQAEYGEDLTRADAVSLLQNVGGVFQVVFGEDANGEGQREED